jgi:type IV pilus assembly protein PilW
VSPRTRRLDRGFTLVELLVGVAVSLVAVAGALVMLQGQQRSFRGSSTDRSLQETGRMALGAISEEVSMAGYGVEPAMVFDFGQLTNVPMERAGQIAGQTVVFGGDAAGTTGFACADPVTCRDSITGPDELAFQYRDPSFNHQIRAVTSETSITIAGPLHQPIRVGQVFQAICISGSMTWAYLRASAEVAATNDATVPITLESGVGLEYPHQNAVMAADPCFSTGEARLLEVQRLRYFVQSYDAAGNVVPWNTAGSRPYLMVDRGLTVNGAPQLEVVAPDVEDLQIAYVFPYATVDQQVAGATSGTRLDVSATGIDFTPAILPTYAAPRLSPIRGTHYPANIRAVRVAIVARSPGPETTPNDGNVPAAGNRPAIAAGDPTHRRATFETSVVAPNLETRAPFFPIIDPTSTVLNVGGG